MNGSTADERLHGVFPIVTSPFHADGSPDTASLRRVADYVVRAGAQGCVYPAIASEFATLADGERESLTAVVAEAVNGRIPLVVGISAETPERSAALARQAAGLGAAALMIMAPRSAGTAADGVARFLDAALGGVALPVILQNAPPPLGSSLPAETVVEILRQVPRIAYVKEEVVPCGQRISALLAAAPGLAGVFGGAGGRFVLDELARGAAGSMPACEVTEIHVALYAAWRAGDRRQARDLFNRVLPLLNMGGVFRTPVTKRALLRRGLIAHPRHRDGNPELDQQDRAELDAILDDLAPLMTTSTRLAA
ncbi:dihydrodipicolinate synthase family protein [Falsiroseomonas sp. HW251]|uniref:dihydrodipicolinate synthase family protein n=1 Tax=Falsiroseomonas sp. HW251 TaxID=3390998 RepID=UPI003D31263B